MCINWAYMAVWVSALCIYIYQEESWMVSWNGHCVYVCACARLGGILRGVLGVCVCGGGSCYLSFAERTENWLG